ncbi:Glycosyltransferase, catalytic subunit of cellulose synthase and poly-beta-1,6-N-acetylglucosamine synthase [Marivirga sericea]|uniref:Glycosyltransferase, catalytic subunit of cellulose synthase and poly-beta-1,6-N-acetylglucosamine synthase n=1 Tax=Marivirga sericea TaxID=1028 RepID=A0A1X7IC94_9BACT|nr:glycosyltransferase [Marivirga sericea]SMG12248.1 Glycosyltransferase, catalytic subunit of cellulose synthase and poly-beta-1,6-N-acetylglucosamine synthase [Marivirga sericea]
MILAFFSIVILFYAVALLFAAKIWRKLPELDRSGELKSVSIVIPFRNESDNLDNLLQSISELDYPHQLLEVILINDHSEDSSTAIISPFEEHFAFKLRVLSLPVGLQGKKSAISIGIQHSSSEVILTSDADCSFPKNWVRTMQAPFEIEHIQLVSGGVVFKTKHFLDRLFQMEFAPLIGVGAVSIELGNPTMANGANLAFRKSTFEKLDPYAGNLAIPSGDDIFLLKRIKAEYPDGVFFQKESVVETLAPKDIRSFSKQRKRWAAKWRASSSLLDSVPAIAVWAFHLMYITAVLYSFITNEFLILLPVIVLKIVSEAIFIASILKSLGNTFKIGVFSILQLIYSFYVIIFGLLANFGNYTWKERKYKSNERAGN